VLAELGCTGYGKWSLGEPSIQMSQAATNTITNSMPGTLAVFCLESSSSHWDGVVAEAGLDNYV
jgi:hypothetical protein